MCMTNSSGDSGLGIQCNVVRPATCEGDRIGADITYAPIEPAYTVAHQMKCKCKCNGSLFDYQFQPHSWCNKYDIQPLFDNFIQRGISSLLQTFVSRGSPFSQYHRFLWCKSIYIITKNHCLSVNGFTYKYIFHKNEDTFYLSTFIIK